ncbi:TMIG2 protein, partial [Chaetops frenatus]|nr:TMIG2 protein [Chaetops frenatus]
VWGATPPSPSTAGALRVSQEPGELQVTAGDTAALRCQVEVAESRRLLLRMEWLRAGGLGLVCATRLAFVTPLPLSPCAPGVRLAWHAPRATLSLPQVRENRSGRYLCRVTLEI